MTDTDIQETGSAPAVFVQGEPGFSHPRADLVICRTDADLDPEAVGDSVIWFVADGYPPPSGGGICTVDGLAAAAALAMDAPETVVVPRAEVRRAAHRYGFNPLNDGSGFSTYQLDPATVSAFSVLEGGEDVPLDRWLKHAAALGFDQIWLHGLDAEKVRRGFPCDLLAKSHKMTPDIGFWISGGGFEPAHFETILPMPGLAALVVDAEILELPDGAALVDVS